MARCPSCSSPLPVDRERVGARCPACRDPLYQPPDRVPRPAGAGEAACTAHPGSVSVGACARCGNFLCVVCRTRWRGRVVCAACVERALAAGAAEEGQGRDHARQAVLGLVLGVAAWAVVALSVLGVKLAVADLDAVNQIAIGLLVFAAVAGGGLAAVFGLGQAVAALRARGTHMILATLGLFLCGLYLGAAVGLTVFNLWLG
jgi:hypothetical protein